MEEKLFKSKIWRESSSKAELYKTYIVINIIASILNMMNKIKF